MNDHPQYYTNIHKCEICGLKEATIDSYKRIKKRKRYRRHLKDGNFIEFNICWDCERKGKIKSEQQRIKRQELMINICEIMENIYDNELF